MMHYHHRSRKFPVIYYLAIEFYSHPLLCCVIIIKYCACPGMRKNFQYQEQQITVSRLCTFSNSIWLQNVARERERERERILQFTAIHYFVLNEQIRWLAKPCRAAPYTLFVVCLVNICGCVFVESRAFIEFIPIPKSAFSLPAVRAHISINREGRKRVKLPI